MSKWYLVKYDDNWADEMDLSSHTVIDGETFEKFKKALDTNPSFTFYVGTNEEIEYGGKYGQDAEDAVSYEEITQEEYNTLKRLGLASSGRFADRFIECVIEHFFYGDSEDDEVDYDEEDSEEDGFYLEHPTDIYADDTRFTDFDEAIKYIEEEHGYEGEYWNRVKASRSFDILEQFLDSDGVFCYQIKGGEWCE
jgi:hypothetical protein